MTDSSTSTAESDSGGFDANAWEEALIADLRANGGRPSEGPLKGQPIIILYTSGAKSGERRRAVLTTSRDGDAYVVAGTASGSPNTPGWIVNLEADPDVEFEFGDRTYRARAEVLREGPERDRLWAQHVEALPHFADYPEQTGRVIPMARIVRTGS